MTISLICKSDPYRKAEIEIVEEVIIKRRGINRSECIFMKRSENVMKYKVV